MSIRRCRSDGYHWKMGVIRCVDALCVLPPFVTNIILLCVFYVRGRKRKVESAEDQQQVLPDRKMTSDTQEEEVVVTLPEHEIEMTGMSGPNTSNVGTSDEVEQETPSSSAYV